MLRVLLDGRPAGWSTIVGRNFNLLAGFTELADQKIEEEDEAQGTSPECYCHGDRNEEAWEVTEQNACSSGCEWAYAFQPGAKPEHDLMLVLSSYRLSGQKMIGFFGQGDAQAVWAPVAVIALRAEEPEWNALDGAPPLDPVFNGHKSAAPPPPLVERDKDRRGIYFVRLAQDAPHYVLVAWEQKERTFYCTCSKDEEAPSPGCSHAQAVRQQLEERNWQARARQKRGLVYVGQRSDDGTCSVTVREEGRPALLNPKPSQRLWNHSAAGFEWGYAGSGPAQLALALLLDFTGNEELAVKHHQEFKSHAIAALPQDASWQIDGTNISGFLRLVSLKE